LRCRAKFFYILETDLCKLVFFFLHTYQHPVSFNVIQSLTFSLLLYFNTERTSSAFMSHNVNNVQQLPPQQSSYASLADHMFERHAAEHHQDDFWKCFIKYHDRAASPSRSEDMQCYCAEELTWKHFSEILLFIIESG